MKAAQHVKYDKNNIYLEIREVHVPRIKDNQVLVKVATAGVNPLDNMISRGELKLVVPYKLPQTAGNELVGYVEKVGDNVRDFKKGDRVFGRLPLDHIGAFAQYVAVDAAALAKVPGYLTDEQAAAFPLAALTIMQALELMEAKGGQSLFISGGSGSLGMIAIPLAKAKGLTVLTSGNAKSREKLMRFGADRYFDYRTEDYGQELSGVDHVLDSVGDREMEKQLSILKKGGKLVSLKAMPDGDFAQRMGLPIWKKWLFGLASRKYKKMAQKYGVTYDFVFVKESGRQLKEAAEIFEKRQLTTEVGAVYAFEDINQALEAVAKRRISGKVILNFK